MSGKDPCSPEQLLARAKELFDEASDGIFIADQDGRYTDVNRSACEMLGYTREELIGKPIVDIIPSEDVPRLAATREYLLSPGKVHLADWTLLKKDGTPVPVEVSAKILSDGRWQAFVRDISERKRIEHALHESEERFRLTIDEAPIGMALVALDGRFTLVNRSLCDIVGYSAAELTGLTFQAITHPDDIEADVVWADRLAREEIRRCQFAKRYVRKDGTIVDALLSVSILRDRRGAPQLYITQIEDVSARKRTEKELRDVNASLDAIIDNVPLMLFVKESDSLRFVRLNRAGCELLGWAEDGLIGKNDYDLWPSAQADFFIEKDRETLKSGKVLDIQEEPIQTRHHGVRILHTRKVPVLDSSGKPLYLLGISEDITERKRSEAALKESEQRLTLALDSAHMGIWDMDLINDTTVRSIRHDQIFGHPSGVPTWGMGTFLDHVVPEDRDTVWRRFEEALVSGSFELECRIRWPDESIHWISSTGNIYRNAQGVPYRMLGTVVDITERKRADEAVRVSEAKFSGIVSISPDAIISTDDDQRITVFNHGAEKIFGYSKAEAIGAPLEMLIPERLRSVGERLTTIAGRRKNGEWFPAEAAISKLRVGDKTILTVALRDITERKRIEKEQQFWAEAGAVLGATLDYEQTLTAVARLVVRDFADWCIVEIRKNQGQLERLRVVCADPSKAALSSQLERISIERNLPHLQREAVKTKRPVLMKRISPAELDAIAQGPEHLELLRAMNPVSAMVLPLISHGELLGTMAFVSSTPSRLYGPSDLRLAEALADRGAVAIENARLYHASVQATRLREQVLGVVAHDLRNPLGVISMQAAGLRRRGPEPDRRSQKPREFIERAATRMNRLIQDLLDVARLEAGQLSVERVPLAADALIVEAVEMSRPTATSSSIEMTLEIARGLPPISGDHDRLLQVLENLIGNAVKFTDAGGRIVVGANSREHDVVFWVADTGCGIAAHSLPRVFDRFWQAIGNDPRGAGLGLPISAGIVEAHRGHIWVESTLGKGSTFFFSIPKAHPVQDSASYAMH